MPINNDGILYKPVGMGDISSAIHNSSLDAGTLCQYTGMNKWAKHKPFRNPSAAFAYDGTQSTPELRSPNRIAAARDASFGLSIPRYNASDFKTYYSTQWSFALPRGASNNPQELYRMLDWDGYLHNCFWQLGTTAAGDTLYTIFDGTLGVPGSTVFSGDTINFGLKCCEESDFGLPGLLYPYDFYKEQQADNDLSRYYMGVALLSGSTLWVITGDQMRSHGPNASSQYAQLLTTVPGNLSDGNFVAIPMLASYQYSSWDSAPGQGYFVSLNGASLSLYKQSSYAALTTTIAVTINGTYIDVVYTIQNVSNSDVQISNLYSFLLSAGSWRNEHDDGYSAPDNVDPSTDLYIEQQWRANGSVTMSNPGGIYLVPDRVSSYPGATSPAYLCARNYNPMSDFLAANPYTYNRYIIRPGSANKVTWSHRFSGYSGDDYGAYYGTDDAGAFVELCIDHFVSGSGHKRYVEYDCD